MFFAESGEARRSARVAGHLQMAYDVSERRACQATGFNRSFHRYRRRSDPQIFTLYGCGAEPVL